MTNTLNRTNTLADITPRRGRDEGQRHDAKQYDERKEQADHTGSRHEEGCADACGDASAAPCRLVRSDGRVAPLAATAAAALSPFVVAWGASHAAPAPSTRP
ncbi:MAG: hypothetical protein R3A10_06175 [Caldilineaceae bacterium]